jgi:hypothetical protein
LQRRLPLRQNRRKLEKRGDLVAIRADGVAIAVVVA